MENKIITRIEHWAKVAPDRVVYDYLGRENTYGELKQYSDALAAKIKSMNLAKDAPVIVYGGQTFEMVATFMGLIKSGHAYIPVDTHSPNERLAIIKKIAEPAVCIAVDELPDLGWDIPVISQKELHEIFTSEITTEPVTIEEAVVGDQNYYILFTSGTTGVPKGVQISYNNLMSFLDWCQGDLGLDFENPIEFVSQPPYSFDISVMYLYSSLLSGGKIDVLPPETTANFKELFKALKSYDIQAWMSTPSFVEICLLSPEFNEETSPELKNIYLCGEELTHKTATRLKERFPNSRIFDIYGPTEATVAVTGLEITDEALNQYDRLPIGWPKPDTPVVIVDEDNNVLPAGEDGELVIMGPSLSKGYINNPEKTAAAFIEIDGKPAYKTGDLAQIDPETGILIYKGRIDFQVKLHGFRIELEDVDHHLDRVSLVEQAITVPRHGADHKVQQLIAYIVPKDQDFASKAELTKAIKAELSEIMMPYMMPNRFVYVESLPLTANGKLDRKTLISEVNSND